MTMILKLVGLTKSHLLCHNSLDKLFSVHNHKLALRGYKIL